MAAVAHWHRRAAKRAETPTKERLTDASLKSEVGTLLARQSTRVVGESDAKAILARYGVPVPVERLTRTIEEAREAIAAVGLPLALKIERPAIPHKTEAGMGKTGREAQRRVGAEEGSNRRSRW